MGIFGHGLHGLNLPQRAQNAQRWLHAAVWGGRPWLFKLAAVLRASSCVRFAEFAYIADAVSFVKPEMLYLK